MSVTAAAGRYQACRVRPSRISRGSAPDLNHEVEAWQQQAASRLVLRQQKKPFVTLSKKKQHDPVYGAVATQTFTSVTQCAVGYTGSCPPEVLKSQGGGCPRVYPHIRRPHLSDNGQEELAGGKHQKALAAHLVCCMALSMLRLRGLPKGCLVTGAVAGHKGVHESAGWAACPGLLCAAALSGNRPTYCTLHIIQP